MDDMVFTSPVGVTLMKLGRIWFSNVFINGRLRKLNGPKAKRQAASEQQFVSNFKDEITL